MTDILQASKFYAPHIGGIERVVQQLAEGSEKEFDHHVLATVPSGRGSEDFINGIPVTRTSSLGTILSVPLSPSYLLRLRQRARQVDIVHYHLPNPLAVVSHYLSGISKPFVVTYHSDIVKQQTALRLYEPLLLQFLDSAERIVTTSPNLLEHSAYLSMFEDKCTVVPLSVDLNTVDLDVECGDTPDEQVVLFVGRLNYYKGVEHLIDAFADLDSSASLLIVGDGERREELEKRVEKLNMSDRVLFLGHVSDSRLQSLYNVADIFALPSVEPSEAFGIVQLEAMAHETPVVNTSLESGVPWVSVEGETGLTVPPRDSNSLATAIDRLLSDDERRRRLGVNARKRVETKFSEERMISQMEDVYRDVP